MQSVALYTLGCKLNQAESAALAEGFTKRDFEIVDFGQPADVCVINTCTVTAKSDHQCRQAIRRAVRSSPGAFIAVVGCYAQLGSEELQAIEGVDVILGSDQKFKIFDYLENLQKREEPEVITCGSHQEREFVNPCAGNFMGHTRAFLKIQDGCDAFCSYCVVPYARGRSRSGHPEAILKYARELVGRGYKEIVLTGVNIGNYGKDLGLPYHLVDLLRDLEKIQGLERIRLSSIEPLEIEDNLIDLITDSATICPHLHIPLQSGDDRILQLMSRNYSVSDYIRIVEKTTAKIPNLGLGTDLIVGFPGEEEAQFENTCRLVEGLPFTYLHVFNYSVREGTKAAQLPQRLDPKIRQARSAQLRALGLKKKLAFYQSFIGDTLKVLFEGTSNNGLIAGFSENYIRIGAEGDENLENQICPVRIEDVRDGMAEGVVVSMITK